MDASIVDILIRSRQTILEILEDRGYDTTPYLNIAPSQIQTLAEGDSRSLDIMVKRKNEDAVCDRAVVVYMLQEKPLRNRIVSFTHDVFETGDVNRTDDLIVLLNEPYHEAFDKASLQSWQWYKIRMTFFHIKQMVVNLSRHVLVPKHRKLTAEESKAEMARLYITQKSQFPLIKHHDIQARLMGLVPGDLVEILRPSPTAGVARILRICAA